MSQNFHSKNIFGSFSSRTVLVLSCPVFIQVSNYVLSNSSSSCFHPRHFIHWRDNGTCRKVIWGERGNRDKWKCLRDRVTSFSEQFWKQFWNPSYLPPFCELSHVELIPSNLFCSVCSRDAFDGKERGYNPKEIKGMFYSEQNFCEILDICKHVLLILLLHFSPFQYSKYKRG